MGGNGSSLPYFLQSFENLTEHFATHFESLGSNERGNRFLALAQKILPFADECRSFPAPQPSKNKSHDDGVDLFTAERPDGSQMCAQSKFKLTSKDELDTVISKFKSYEARVMKRSEQTTFLESGDRNSKPTFVIVTSSKLSGVIAAYEKSELASKTYYESLLSDKRLCYVDGPRILSILQSLYRKAYVLPSGLDLPSATDWMNVGNVYLGVVKAQDITSLYSTHGDALFFENIRDFLGLTSGKKETEGRETVNSQIIDTVKRYSERMLERNNGITFRAASATIGDGKKLKLEGAAIVNGCQTTMCLWHSREELSPGCHVAVKVVVTDDAWAVAKAANYQNAVAQIDLDLARYLRPQLIQRAATQQGYGMASGTPETIIGVLNSIYQKRIEYEEMKSLYLGLFSRKPNNLFTDNYTDLRSDVLEGLFQHGSGDEERVFATVFLIVTKAAEASDTCTRTFTGHEYEHFFKRFRDPDKPRYRAYMSVLALCGALEQNLAKRSLDCAEEVQRMERFLTESRALIENEAARFIDCYVIAYQVLAMTALQALSRDGTNDSQVAQEMHKRISQAQFDALYAQVRMQIDANKRSRTTRESS